MSFRTDHDPVGVSSGRRAAMPPALKTTSDRARAELGRDVLQPPTGGDCGVTRELRGVRCALERGRYVPTVMVTSRENGARASSHGRVDARVRERGNTSGHAMPRGR